MSEQNEKDNAEAVRKVRRDFGEPFWEAGGTQNSSLGSETHYSQDEYDAYGRAIAEEWKAAVEDAAAPPQENGEPQ